MPKQTDNAAQLAKLKSCCDKSTGCWLWTRSKRNRYGVLWYDGKLQYCHRLSWLIHKGQIPEGKHILHKCDVPACFNPDHLFVGTPAENNHDMRQKRRYPNKLTDEQTAEIRRLNASGVSQHKLGPMFGVSQAAIWYVLRRRDGWRAQQSR